MENSFILNISQHKNKKQKRGRKNINLNEKFEFLDSECFEVVVFSFETVIQDGENP